MKRALGIVLVTAGSLVAARIACAAPAVFGNPAVTHHAPKRTYHVENYRLALHFNPTMSEVFGDETITLTPRVATLRRFYLDSAELTIKRVTLDESPRQVLPLTFSTSRSRLWITLNRPYPRGAVIRVEIRYHGVPRTGLIFVKPNAHYPHWPREIWSQGEPEFNHFWFPCWDYPNDMSTSETVTTVQTGLRVVSNGRLIKVARHRGFVTYDWVESIPHSTYLTSIAVGPWREVRDHYGTLPVDYFVPRSVSAASARRTFGLTPDMIGFFGRALGVPYPYEKYDQIAVKSDPFGGMENVTATTITDDILGSARADSAFPSQGVVSHELGQHWFGDYVQARDWADIWLNEGFATYLQDLYTQYHDGNDAFRLQMRHDQLVARAVDREAYVRPIVDDHYSDPLQMFDAITHQKGAVVLDMLRNLLDGPAETSKPASQRELFFRALKSYLTTYATRTVTTAELVRTLEKVSGRRLGWFFHEWVYRGGHPDYRVTASYDAHGGREMLRVAQTQRGAEVSRAFVMPVTVTIHGAREQSKTVRIEDRRRLQTFAIAVNFTPLWVDFDPNDIIEKSLHFPQPVSALIAKSEHDPAAMSRIAAVSQLGMLGKGAPPAVVPALIHVLATDPFYGVREQAAASLGRLHTHVADRALLRALRQRNYRVREAVIEALSGTQTQAVYHALVARLHDDSSEAVQAAAARALGHETRFGAYWALKSALKRDLNDHVMGGLFSGLVATRDPRVAALLLGDARAGVRTQVRFRALEALEGTASFLPKSDRTTLVAVVRSALRDPTLLIKLEGESLCGVYGLKQCVVELRRLAKTEPTAFQRANARQALSRLEKHHA